MECERSPIMAVTATAVAVVTAAALFSALAVHRLVSWSAT